MNSEDGLLLGKTVSWNPTAVIFSSVQLLSCVRLCDAKNRSMPSLPVHHQLPESTQTHVHWVSGASQPSHPLLSPSLPAFNLAQHQGLFLWVSSSHQVAKVRLGSRKIVGPRIELWDTSALKMELCRIIRGRKKCRENYWVNTGTWEIDTTLCHFLGCW